MVMFMVWVKGMSGRENVHGEMSVTIVHTQPWIKISLCSVLMAKKDIVG